MKYRRQLTYLVDGKQYIMVAIGGGNSAAEYLAFTLPSGDARPTTQQGAQQSVHAHGDAHVLG